MNDVSTPDVMVIIELHGFPITVPEIARACQLNLKLLSGALLLAMGEFEPQRGLETAETAQIR